MSRAKRKLELLRNPRERRQTFLRRMEGLKKKAFQLKTLCNIEVGLIVQNGPNLGKLDSDPVEEIWPSNHDQIKQLITSYKAEPDRLTRSVDLWALIKAGKIKVEEDQIIKLKGKNKVDDMYPKWDDRYNLLVKNQLEEFGGLLDEKIQFLKTQLETMRRNNSYLLKQEIAAENEFSCQQPITWVKFETGGSSTDNQVKAENSEANLAMKDDPCYTQLDDLYSSEFLQCLMDEEQEPTANNFDYFLNQDDLDYLGIRYAN